MEKDPLDGQKDRRVLTEPTKQFIDRVLDPSVQLTFKELLLLTFGVISKKTIHDDFKRRLKHISLFNSSSVAKSNPPYTSAKTSESARRNTEADTGSQLSPLRQGYKRESSANRELPGGPGLGIGAFAAVGPGLIPGQGTKTL